jgi:hypothetical protein
MCNRHVSFCRRFEKRIYVPLPAHEVSNVVMPTCECILFKVMVLQLAAAKIGIVIQ